MKDAAALFLTLSLGVLLGYAVKALTLTKPHSNKNSSHYGSRNVNKPLSAKNKAKDCQESWTDESSELSDNEVGDDDGLPVDDYSSEEEYKMMLVVRNDLKMTKGKIAAQCGHATLGAYKKARSMLPHSLRAWEQSGQAKVAVKVDSEEQLQEVCQRAKARKLNFYLVVDAGRTQIPGGSKTVVGIGPAPASRFAEVTESLKLL